MATNLIDLENHLDPLHTSMTTGNDFCSKETGEWDISLFDELEYLGDEEELLRIFESVPYTGDAPDLDFGFNLSTWGTAAPEDTSSSCCTEADMTIGCLSPNMTTSSVSSPGSVEALSPYYLQEEALLLQSPPSPASVHSDTSSPNHADLVTRPQRKSSQASRAKLAHPPRLIINPTPKVSIQPKPAASISIPVLHSAVPLQAKTIIIQPLCATLPMVRSSPVSLCSAPPAGRPVMQTMLQMCVPQVAPAPAQPLPDRTVIIPTGAQDRGGSLGQSPAFPQPTVTGTYHSAAVSGNSPIGRRHQRMMKNRESACLSRRKKKEHLLTLEARLKVALFENQKLKSENSSLKIRLGSLSVENNGLKVAAPKRRAVCLLVVMAFVMLNVGPTGLFEGDPISRPSAGAPPAVRHLLGFSTADNENNRGLETPETDVPQAAERWEMSTPEEKALMVVKRHPLLFGVPRPCHSPVNRTKAIKLASELRGWVHRHESERVKSRSQHKTKAMPKSLEKKSEVAEFVTVQYTDITEKNSASELQVYYARHGSYNDFFEEIRRRGDTFYVVSFRRDHLLLPATNHSKGQRPKMSLVLPAMNLNETVIEDKEYEVMMQIDCEVMDTRILHIKTASIPAFLRTNNSNTYHSTTGSAQVKPPVGVLPGSAES
ncbi:hypothetical protein SKAU_G00199770 [Synaphobranchus kaupii]|uniref:BZIP domain-containing protein n=1 Tax=Synaphobranchus kaupii TaxID=118154 RepID=A0A9Q1FF61_SYNKA|nr:hypothetical protein SKAU_G00199770 [Synaphobranchus kaupii]